MNTTFSDRYLWTSEPNIPKSVLNAMFKQCKNTEFENSTILGDGSGLMSQIRTSKQAWLCCDTWISGIMYNIFMVANSNYFKYDLDHFESDVQLTKYETNAHYGWHVDELPVVPPTLPRKLSMSLLLNDDFEGGELELAHAKEKPITVDMKAGSVCVFPSWLMHRVKPVTKGTRYSLVAWMNGPEFK